MPKLEKHTPPWLPCKDTPLSARPYSMVIVTAHARDTQVSHVPSRSCHFPSCTGCQYLARSPRHVARSTPPRS